MVPRSAAVALLAVVAASGCRSFGFGVQPPAPVASPATADAREVIRLHNQNAQRISGLRAKPSIVGRVEDKRFTVKGRMALERPRNFRLELGSTFAGEVADLGSNTQGFWFWVRDSKPRAIYVCNYDETGTSPVPVAFQPDWIVEALGLLEIPADASVEKGSEAGTVVVTQRLDNGPTKRTVLDSATGQIREHRVYAADRKTVLAQAVVTAGYRRVPVPATGGDGTEPPVLLPRKVRLVLAQNQMELDIDLDDVEANPPLDAVRAQLFAEPDKTREGYARVNLRDDLKDRSDYARATPTTVRETPSPPASGGGIRLRDPVPLGDDKTPRTPDEPLPLTPDLPAASTRADAEEVVGARIPRAPGLGALASGATGWRQVSPPGFER
jgi:hypothetical protein